MNTRLLLLPFAFIAFFAAAACGGDDDDVGATATRSPAATETPDADDKTEAPLGASSGRLTVGDDSWDFANVFCGFAEDDNGLPDVSFLAGSFLQSVLGYRMQFDVTILDPLEQGRYEGEGVTHSVSLIDLDSIDNPRVSWLAVAGQDGADQFIQIDGDHVTAEAIFDDTSTNDVEQVPGHLELVCA